MTIRERFEKLHSFGVFMAPDDSRAVWLADVTALADELDEERERQTAFLRKLLHGVERLDCMGGAGPLRSAIEAELHAPDAVTDEQVTAFSLACLSKEARLAILRQWCSGCGGEMPCSKCGRNG